MTGSSCLLDTCIVIDIFRNKLLAEKLDEFETVYISSITLGELYFGAYHSTSPSKKIQQIKDLSNNLALLIPDMETAQMYGQIKTRLKQKGKPIPENDIWIASIALQHQLPLYTSDNHFTEVDSISLINL